MTSTFVRSPVEKNAFRSKSEAYLKAAKNYFESASEKAELGDIQASAIFILKALDQERRAGSVGPQVLQLIKPRS